MVAWGPRFVNAPMLYVILGPQRDLLSNDMKSLLRFFSFNSYVWLAVGLFAVLVLVLAPGGLSPLKTGILALYVAGAVALGFALRTPRAQLNTFDGMAAFEAALRGPRPTLLEFYADNCGVCMTMRPVMDRLERDAGHRLQILRVNVKDPIGVEIADRYRVTFTPTFLLFNSAGWREEEFTLVLDRARVLYWLDQQTITP
jgi:thiol-disulfide isomerase/thioredoxin